MSGEEEHRAEHTLYCPTCELHYESGDRCPSDGTSLVRLRGGKDPLIGASLDGRYTVEEVLGAGAMGTVYRAVQHAIGRDVAVKVVNPTLVQEPKVVRRFLREAKLASRLSHPNAVGVLDFGQTEDGLFYLVMECLRGRTLDKLLDDGPLSLPRALRITGQICLALEGAHAMKIVHRDLKPSNIMIAAQSEADLVKVLDFGLAKSLSEDTTMGTVTGTGAVLGTPVYMSPEAATAGDVDGRADLYSLGCILYQMVAGRPPFISGSVPELLHMHAVATPPSLGAVAPAWLGELVERLLAKDPADRPSTAAELRQALARGAEGGSPEEALEPTLIPESQEITNVGRTRDAPVGPVGAAESVADRGTGSGSRGRRIFVGALVAAALAGGAAAFFVSAKGDDRTSAAVTSADSGASPSAAGPIDAAVEPDARADASAGGPADAAAAEPAPSRRPGRQGGRNARPSAPDAGKAKLPY